MYYLLSFRQRIMPDSPGGEEARISRILSKKAKKARKDPDGKAARLHPGRLRRPGRGAGAGESCAHTPPPSPRHRPMSEEMLHSPTMDPRAPLPRGVPTGKQPHPLFSSAWICQKNPRRDWDCYPAVFPQHCIFTTPEPLFSARNAKEKKMLVIRKDLAICLRRGEKKRRLEKSKGYRGRKN